MKHLFKFLFVIIFLLAAKNNSAQCTRVLPANTAIISVDSTINCSVGQWLNKVILICPGAHLFVIGNSTSMNNFYIESGATVTFADSFPPGAPYGIFSFYVKQNGTLNFNQDSHVAFPIDTLFYENGAVLTDTGTAIQHQQICSPLVFDYSLLPGGVGCAGNQTQNLFSAENISISPNPFQNAVSFQPAFSSTEKYLIEITDACGRKVFEETTIFPAAISFENINAGNIFFYFISKNEEVIQKGTLVRE